MNYDKSLSSRTVRDNDVNSAPREIRNLPLFWFCRLFDNVHNPHFAHSRYLLSPLIANSATNDRSSRTVNGCSCKRVFHISLGRQLFTMGDETVSHTQTSNRLEPLSLRMQENPTPVYPQGSEQKHQNQQAYWFDGAGHNISFCLSSKGLSSQES